MTVADRFHFLLSLWSHVDDDAELAAQFAPVAEALAANEETIVAELNSVQCAAADIGGYYHPDIALTEAVMRPSATPNGIIDG